MATLMRRFHDMPFGASLSERGTCRFQLWAPAAREVKLRLRTDLFAMREAGQGWWRADVAAQRGDPYAFRIDNRLEVPDPASRSQAEDVHGPSLVVDPGAFDWGDVEWRGRPWHEAVIYELHVGTFTSAGTFLEAVNYLDDLVDLGVTAVELMPIADFPGAHDWGYDGVLLFAPDRRYGKPEDLKTFVFEAHRRGLMVLLDVVYNHFGPEGNYLHIYAPQFFSNMHRSPWGEGINFDGEDCATVRDFFIHNAIYWLDEFHFDGLRLDAIHAVHDESQPDIVEELRAKIGIHFSTRHVHLILENDCNSAHYLRGNNSPFAAQWNDDFHHALHVITTGEEGGYYRDFAQNPHVLLARCLCEGFAFQGEYSPYRGRPRGEPSRDLPLTAFVNFLQNHDQIGNRAFGERLTVLSPQAALRAATVILLLAPSPPLLFMGQEWGSTRPFPFFCDFGPELAKQVTEGRQREFARFAAFADPAQRARIPDPQAPATFASAILDRAEVDNTRSREWREFHRALLHIRHEAIIPGLDGMKGPSARAMVASESLVIARWSHGSRGELWLLANLGHEAVSDVKVPAQGMIYGTPDLFGENDTLSGWGVAWYIVTGPEDRVLINGAPVFD